MNKSFLKKIPFKQDGTTLVRKIGSSLILQVLRFFNLKTRISDPTSGFRVYSKESIKHLLRCIPDEYPEPESIAILALNHRKIDEIPASMQYRLSGVSSLRGLNGIIYMAKVISSLIGLRLRFLFKRNNPGSRS